MKDKTHKVKSVKALLDAIEEYKKLPLELRAELEKDKSSNASRISQFEKLCNEAV
jgi:predicted enzyme involved in methoxymalonyl-ACP biosynthesis